MPVASELLVKIGADTREAEQGISRVDGLVSGFAKGAGALGGIATAAFAGIGAAAIGLGGIIGSSVGAATDFEHAMSGVGAVAGASASELGQLSQMALALGQDTSLAGVGASDAAAAMEQLASGGLSVADILGGAARGALLLASAGGIDVASAASIAAAALNNFGLAGNQTSHVADLFAAAANSSAVTVTDLGESLKYIGPIANSMGMSIEEVTATLAALGDQGIKGSQAGTSLRSILVSLSDPSKEAASKIKELGLQFFDSQGKMKGFGDISEELKTKMAGLTDQQRAAALSTIFGSEALSAATVLYGEGAAGIAKYLAQVDVAGSAADNGAKRNDNLRGSIESLKGAWETAQIVLGQAFLPALRGLVDGAAKAVSGAIPLIQMWGPRFVAMLTTGMTAVMGFGRSVGSAIGTVIDAFRKLLAGDINFAQFIGGMEIWITTIRNNLAALAQQAAPYLGAFFSAVGSFIRAAAPQLAAQLGLWAASFVDWIQTTALPWLVPRLQLLLTTIGTWITGTALPAIGGWLMTVGQAFGNWVTTTALPYLQTNLPIWLSALGTWLSGTALPAVGGFLGMIGQKFGTWVSETAIPWLMANVPQWLAALGGWITGTALPAVGAALQGMGQAMGSWITETAIPFLQTNLPLWWAAYQAWADQTRPVVVAKMKEFASAMGDWIANDAIPFLTQKLPEWVAAYLSWADSTGRPAVIGAMKAMGEAMGTWVTETAIPWVLQHLPGWQAAISDFIFGTALPAIGTALLTVGEAFGNFITEKAVPFVVQKLPEWQTAIGTWLLGTAAPAIGRFLITVGEKFGDFITEKAVPYLQAKIPEWLAAIRDYLTGTALPAIQAKALELGTALVEKFMEEAQKLKDRVAAEMAQVPGRIVSGLGNLAGLLVSAGEDLIRGMIAGIRNMAGALASAAADAASSALQAAKDALGIRSPSTAFAEVGRYTMLGLVEGIESQRGRVGNTVRETAGAIAQQMTDALSTLRVLADTPLDQTMAAITKRFRTDFDIAVEEMAAAASAAGDFLTQAQAYRDLIKMAVAAIREAQGLLNQINIGAGGALPDLRGAGENVGHNVSEGIRRSLDIHSPSGVTTEFGRAVVQGMIVGMTEEQASAAKTAADVASAVAKAIQDTLTTAKALSALKLSDLPGAAQVGGILAFTRGLVAEVAASATLLGTQLVEDAAAWSEAASKTVALFSGGVDAIGKLAGYAQVGQGAIDNFGADLRVAVNDLVFLANEIAIELVEKGTAFSESAAKGIAIFGNGVAGFDALRDYVQVGSAAIYAFGKDMRLAVADLAAIVDIIGQEVADKAGALGEQVSKATGGVANAVAGFVALKDYVRVPLASLYGFGKDLMLFMADFAAIIDLVGVEMVTKAGTLGEAIGKIFGSVGSAVSGLKSLFDFISPPESALDAFEASVTSMIRRMVALAGTLATQGVDAASLLGESLSKVFSGLNAGTSFFKSLNDILLPDQAGIDRILAPMLAVVRTLAEASRTLDATALASAGNLAEAFSRIFAGVEAGNRALVPATTTGNGSYGGGGGTTYIYQFYVSAPVYGFDSFEDEVVGAIETARRRGRDV